MLCSLSISSCKGDRSNARTGVCVPAAKMGRDQMARVDPPKEGQC